MTLNGRLLRAFDEVDDALACFAERYDIALDLRDLADKNPALAKMLRRSADKIDDISRDLLSGSENLTDLEHMVEAAVTRP
ncbi:hypothetical protein EOW77_0006490 [Bradyrhizobium yuanmingense]|uniref:hypothetical protein n=1 Tax=Bradyrhizobium yuanmingense TaxID=108015 RepID=UPI000FE2DE20|nr:hypothetical protein [Bradyrhizobium yuanmingense]TGN89937.1 hypothetical protein EOW77_0006490 [Bradyrhizobium yuanmingense]